MVESCFTPFDNLDTCLQAAYDGDLVTLKTFDERQVTHARACCFSSWNAVHMAIAGGRYDVFAYLVVNFPDWKYGNKVSSDHYEKKQSSLLDLALGRGRYFLLDDDVKTEEPPSDSDKGAIVRLLRQGYIVKPCDWTIQKTIWEGWKDLGSVLHALPIDVVIRNILFVMVLGPLVILTFCCGSVWAGSPTLSLQNVNDITAALTTAFQLRNGYCTPCNKCPLGLALGGMVRLAFHDVIGGGGPSGNGGANGCIDGSAADNKGLAEIIATYETVYSSFSSVISRGDLWQLGANLAIAFATTNSGSPCGPGITPTPGTLVLPFRYGRIDQPNCTGFDEAFLPKASFSWSQMTNTFVTRVGMSVAELTAIMGAHSLGGTTFANSGFEGSWTATASTFSNFYHRSIVNQRIRWQNPNISAGGNAWLDLGGAVNPPVLMLKVDVEPLYSPSSSCASFIDGSGNQNGNPGCTLNTASGNPAASVNFYATSICGFFSNFTSAWKKLMEFGYNDTSLSYVSGLTNTSRLTCSVASGISVVLVVISIFLISIG